MSDRDNDVTALEQAYLAKDGLPPDDSIPPDFRELLPTLQDHADARATDRKTRLTAVRQLLILLDSSDNQVVKMQKRRAIRAELNALKQIDAMED